MTISSLIDTPSELTDATSSKTAIVLMTRVRLARNLAGNSFPGWAKPAQREEILATCREAVAVTAPITIDRVILDPALIAQAPAPTVVDGVDMIFIGRNDLAADCGHILELDHPEVVAMLRGVATVAQKAGKKIGTVPSAGLGWAQLFKDGFDMVLPSGDISLLRDACLAEVRSFRESFGGSRNHPPQKVVSVPDPPPKSSAITRADA